jgi:hypothetical protein
MKTANVCPSTRFSVALDKDALGCPNVPYSNNGLMQDQVQLALANFKPTLTSCLDGNIVKSLPSPRA